MPSISPSASAAPKDPETGVELPVSPVREKKLKSARNRPGTPFPPNGVYEAIRSSMSGMFRKKNREKEENSNKDGDQNAATARSVADDDNKLNAEREDHINAMASVHQAVAKVVKKTEEKVEAAICDILTLDDDLGGLRKRVDEQNVELRDQKRKLVQQDQKLDEQKRMLEDQKRMILEQDKKLEEQGKKLADVELKRLNLMDAILAYHVATFRSLERWQDSSKANLDYYVRKTQSENSTYVAEVCGNLALLSQAVKDSG